MVLPAVLRGPPTRLTPSPEATRNLARLTSCRLRCLRNDVSENIHHRSSIPHVGTYSTLRTEGCLPRESSQGKSDSRYLAHLLEDVYNPATSPSSSQFFTPPPSPPSLLNSSFYPHSYQPPRLLTLLSSAWILRSFCYYPQLFVLHSSLLDQFPQSPPSTHEFRPCQAELTGPAELRYRGHFRALGTYKCNKRHAFQESRVRLSSTFGLYDNSLPTNPLIIIAVNVLGTRLRRVCDEQQVSYLHHHIPDMASAAMDWSSSTAYLKFCKGFLRWHRSGNFIW